MDKRPLIDIVNLAVEIQGKPILKGFSLQINPGEVHVIMGPNGAGKSTLAKVLSGHPSYEVVGGTVFFQGEDLQALSPEERSHRGLFLGFQYPVEIGGVLNQTFLQAAYDAKRKAKGEPPMLLEHFEALLDEKMEAMEIRSEFKKRSVNEGFSGGEKKKNEILQMSLLEPTLAVLDETDSGLDIDAIRIVAQGVNRMRHLERSFLIITHYQRLLDYIKPDFVHVMIDGRIVQTGDADLALALEKRGYA